ncbi:MAG: VacJ family lipoprotein [Gammaproteobacteria bacterium]|nr:VacJ family lipoprotein [Gammaproteobacteria bacterium]
MKIVFFRLIQVAVTRSSSAVGLLFFLAVACVCLPPIASAQHIDASHIQLAALEQVANESAQLDIDDDEFDALFDDAFDDEVGDNQLAVADPMEPFNRAMFWFNDRLYFYLFKPVAKAYRVVPEPARVSVSNFFSNLATPIRFLNALFQLKFKDAGVELTRFTVNSTVGILGLFDPAKDMGFTRKDEDFGQTLGEYGVGPGFYIVLPFFGPSSARDGIGMLVDGYADPVLYGTDDALEYLAVKAVDSVNALSIDKDTYDAIVKESLDPYLFVRDAYIQHREGKIRK